MEEIFLKIFNMCFSASWLVLAVLVLRVLLRKAPKTLRVVMWGLVGLRLVLPFSIRSPFSLLPSAQVISQESLYSSVPRIQTGLSSFNTVINNAIESGTELASQTSEIASPSPPLSVTEVLSYVWTAGIAAMLIYFFVSLIIVRMRVRESIKEDGGYYICDRISSAFVLGTLHPKVYVPSNIDKNDLQYILTHERMHLRRRDNIFKPFAFLLLCVYWFNPLLWAAYILFCRDIEYACDECVIRDMGEDYKKPYSLALINNSVSHGSISRCPVAFGSTAVKSRVKGVLSYKRPAFWVILISIVLCIALALCFLTDPKAAEKANSGNDGGNAANTVNTEIVEISTTKPYSETSDTTVPTTVPDNSNTSVNSVHKTVPVTEKTISTTQPTTVLNTETTTVQSETYKPTVIDERTTEKNVSDTTTTTTVIYSENTATAVVTENEETTWRLDAPWNNGEDEDALSHISVTVPQTTRSTANSTTNKNSGYSYRTATTTTRRAGPVNVLERYGYYAPTYYQLPSIGWDY